MREMYVEEKPYLEYLDGEPHRKVSPRIEHGIVQMAMGRILYELAGKRGVVATELDALLGRVDGTRTRFVPDVAYVSRERLDALTGEDRHELPFAPDIAVEVWSPSNDRAYLDRKIARYLATRSILVLDVDPSARTIVAHDASGAVAFGVGDTFEHGAARWLHFRVADVFADLDPM